MAPWSIGTSIPCFLGFMVSIHPGHWSPRIIWRVDNLVDRRTGIMLP